MISIEDRIISALRSSVFVSRLSPLKMAVSIDVKTAVGEQVRLWEVSKMVKEATMRIVAQLKVLAIIAGGLTKSDKIMSPIPKFVATTVK